MGKAWNKGLRTPVKIRSKLREAKLNFYKNGGIHPMKGKHHSEKTREKIRLSLLGKPNSRKGTEGKKWAKRHRCIVCNSEFYVRPSHVSKEWGKFCSHKCKGKWQEENYIGEKNPFFKDGKAKEIDKLRKRKKYLEWKKQIKKRDDFSCKKCGSKEKLEIHHIKPFRIVKDYALENGITLCQPCHLLEEKLLRTGGYCE